MLPIGFVEEEYDDDRPYECDLRHRCPCGGEFKNWYSKPNLMRCERCGNLTHTVDFILETYRTIKRRKNDPHLLIVELDHHGFPSSYVQLVETLLDDLLPFPQSPEVKDAEH